MFSASTAVLQSVIKELSNAGCCSRCILRFLGEKIPNFYTNYQNVTEKLQKILGTDTSEEECFHISKKGRHNSCTACLGILTDLCDISALEKIKAEIQHENFEFEEFVLSLILPICYLTRQHMIFLHLKKKFPSLYDSRSSHDIPSVKEVWKWIVGPYMERQLNVNFSIHSPFEINVSVEFESDIEESTRIMKTLTKGTKSESHGRRNRVGFSRAAFEKKLSETSDDKIIELLPWPPSIPTRCSTYSKITCSHKPLYIAGRYIKYSRNLSQTPWLIDGEKLMETSIQEIICDILTSHIKADEIRFSASGREDVDVRTLGKGRPFLLEFVNPRQVRISPQEINTFQKEINASTDAIAVRDLQIVARNDINNLKKGEEEKTKIYSAVCSSQEEITQKQLDVLETLQNIKIAQKTPIRVLHRRPLAVRDKFVHQLKGTLIDSHTFKLTLKTQAGTYIKEFVHSDFGRTYPSLGTILKVEVDILELDVEAVELDWPPSLED